MAIYVPLVNIPIQYQDINTSANLSGGSIEFYEAGTATETNIYSDNAGTVLGTSVTLSAGGMPQSGGSPVNLFRDQSLALKLVLKDSDGLTVNTFDNIPAEASFTQTASDKLDGIEAKADKTDIDNVQPLIVGAQEYPVPFGDFYLPTTAPAGASAVVETTAGLPNYRGYPFSGTPATVENIEFEWLPPKRWNLGTVKLAIYYTTEATDSDGVSWYGKAVALSDGSDYAQSYGTPVSVDDTLQGGAAKLLVATTGNITIGGTPADGCKVMFRIYRDPDDANDTAAEDAILVRVKVLWTSDQVNDA